VPVARNVTSFGSNDAEAAYGDYIAGGIGGQWQVFESAPSIASVAGNAIALDFSMAGSWIINLIASTTFTITLLNIPVGQPARVITQQPSSGSGAVTWASPNLRWSGGTTGQATAGSSVIDVFVFYSPMPGTVLAGVAMPNC
jgi:hypothetical protein